MAKDCLAGETWRLKIGFDEEQNFLPGQYLNLKVTDEGKWRSYSVASLPGKTEVELVVNISPMGVGSRYIVKAEVGQDLEIVGYMGRFVVENLPAQNDKKMLFVANGVGVAPLKPMIEDLLKNKNYQGKADLLWGMRREEDLYWLDELQKMTETYPGFGYEIVLSRPGDDWPGLKGHVDQVVERYLEEEEKPRVYLCGSPEMIEEMKKKLLRGGVKEEEIIYERFA